MLCPDALSQFETEKEPLEWEDRNAEVHQRGKECMKKSVGVAKDKEGVQRKRVGW